MDDSGASAGELRIMKWVVLREACLEKLHEVTESSCRQSRHRGGGKPGGGHRPGAKERRRLTRLLLELVTVLRRITVETVEAIEGWRGAGSERPFLWGGSNYLVKAARDVHFLARVPALEEDLGVHIAGNPLLCHVGLDGRPASRPSKAGRGGQTARKPRAEALRRIASDSLGVSPQRTEAAVAVLRRELRRAGQPTGDVNHDDNVAASGSSMSGASTRNETQAPLGHPGACARHKGLWSPTTQSHATRRCCPQAVKLGRRHPNACEHCRPAELEGQAEILDRAQGDRSAIHPERRGLECASCVADWGACERGKADAFRGTKVKGCGAPRYRGTSPAREKTRTVVTREAQAGGRSSQSIHSPSGIEHPFPEVWSEGCLRRDMPRGSHDKCELSVAKAIGACGGDGFQGVSEGASRETVRERWHNSNEMSATTGNSSPGFSVARGDHGVLESPFAVVHTMCDGLLTHLQARGLGGGAGTGAASSTGDCRASPTADGNVQTHASTPCHSGVYDSGVQSTGEGSPGREWCRALDKRVREEGDKESDKGSTRSGRTEGVFDHANECHPETLTTPKSRNSREGQQTRPRVVSWGRACDSNTVDEELRDDPIETLEGKRARRITPSALTALVTWAAWAEARVEAREAQAARHRRLRQLRCAMSAWDRFCLRGGFSERSQQVFVS